jgi:hypothetical protein
MQRDEENRMKLYGRMIGLAVLAALAAPRAAIAQDCPGVFIRDSQSYDTHADPSSVERVNVVIPKGTRDTFVGYVVIGGKTFYVQLRAFLHNQADVRLDAGCVLGKYE